ncbi:MAG: hypothetical protein EKK44_08170 [Methylobacterium sp.]|nr:hypothetical protein [Methylobacterium sp.]RUP21720.1 MAG: hypothetical protein EKK44_08170 [Methylobacterium sp.]
MRAPQPNPYLVLAVAILLPGVGHILIGKTQRGLGFAFFTLVGAWLTTKFAAPDIDIIGRHAAGLFVWALSVPDAYRSARLLGLKSSGSAAAASLARPIP